MKESEQLLVLVIQIECHEICGHSLQSWYRNFINAALHNKKFLVPTDDAIRAIEFIEGCSQSIEKGTPIKLGQGGEKLVSIVSGPE